MRTFEAGLTAHLVAGPGLLVAVDVDGTLLRPDGAVAPGVRDAVHAVRGTGTHLVFATGRSYRGLRPVLDDLGIADGWAVTSNGAVVVRLDAGAPDGHELTDVVTFDPEPALRLLREHLPDGAFAVERAGEGFLVTGRFPEGELPRGVRSVPFETLCEAPASRVTVRAPALDADGMREVVARSGLAGVTYAIGWTAWLDLTPVGVTKASALETLRTRLDITSGASLAVGDGHNDEAMLRWAGVGVAMGDGDPVALAAADAVTLGSDRDGLEPVLRSLISPTVAPAPGARPGRGTAGVSDLGLPPGL